MSKDESVIGFINILTTEGSQWEKVSNVHVCVRVFDELEHEDVEPLSDGLNEWFWTNVSYVKTYFKPSKMFTTTMVLTFGQKSDGETLITLIEFEKHGIQADMAGYPNVHMLSSIKFFNGSFEEIQNYDRIQLLVGKQVILGIEAQLFY